MSDPGQIVPLRYTRILLAFHLLHLFQNHQATKSTFRSQSEERCPKTKTSELKNGYWKNKYAFQLGTKQFDLFKIKGLGLNSEFNWVKPYTYSHFEGIMNYGHFNSPLAHPYGANFYELNNI